MARPKIRMAPGADRLIVEPGGAIEIQRGGAITAAGAQASAIADFPDPAKATIQEVAEKQNAILAALRGAGIIATNPATGKKETAKQGGEANDNKPGRSKKTSKGN